MARPSTPLSDTQKNRIIELLKQGQSLMKIAPQLKPPIAKSDLPRKVRELGLQVVMLRPPEYGLVPIRPDADIEGETSACPM